MWKSAQIGVFFKEGRFLSTQIELECGRWNSYTLPIYTIIKHYNLFKKCYILNPVAKKICRVLKNVTLLYDYLSKIYYYKYYSTVQSFSYHQQWLNSFMHMSFKVCQQDKSHQPFSAYFSDKFQANILSWKLWMRQSKNLFLIAVITVKLYVSPYHKNLFSSSLWWKRT